MKQKKSWLSYFFNPNKLGTLCILLICFIGFSTPITSTVPYFLGIDSSPINISLNAFYLLTSFYLIIGATTQKQSKYISYGGWLILAFWFLYSCRIIYDTQIAGVRFKDSLFIFYSLAFGNCLIASMAVIFNARYIKLKQANLFFFVIIFFSNISILFLTLSEYGTLNPLEVAARANFTVEIGRDSKSVLNPITISYFGELLALMSIGNLLFLRHRFYTQWFLLITFLQGILVLALGASRGPMVAFLLLLFLLIIFKLIMSRRTTGFYIRLVVLPMLLLPLLSKFIASNIEWDKIRVLGRLSNFVEDRRKGKKETRDYQWEAAWEQFKEHPIIGDQFLERYANFYPHNILLESLMATGLIGSTLFFSLILYTLYKVLFQVLRRQKAIIFSILLLAILIGNLFSGSLFSSGILWILIAFICSISQKEIQAFNFS